MAIGILNAPAMSAESEQVSSAARRTMPWTRARSKGDIIKQLDCLRHWQRSGLITEQFEALGGGGDGDDDELYSPDFLRIYSRTCTQALFLNIYCDLLYCNLQT